MRSSVRFRGLAVAIACALLAGALAAGAPTAAQEEGAALATDPTVGAPGTAALLLGYGFTPGDDGGRLVANGQIVATAAVDEFGYLLVPFVVPQAIPGPLLLTFTDGANVSATTIFTVTLPPFPDASFEEVAPIVGPTPIGEDELKDIADEVLKEFLRTLGNRVNLIFFSPCLLDAQLLLTGPECASMRDALRLLEGGGGIS